MMEDREIFSLLRTTIKMFEEVKSKTFVKNDKIYLDAMLKQFHTHCMILRMGNDDKNL